MQRLQQGVRAGIIDPQYGTLQVQGRMLAERCQVFTPPRNVGQGKAAVARDITTIFRPLSHTTFDNKSLKKIIRTDDRPAWDKVAKNLRGAHNLQNTIAVGFSTAWHKKNRNKRGRAFKAKYGNMGVVTLGPEARKVREYIKDKKGMVGWARAGWNSGILGLGGQIKAQWVNRHGMGQGFLVNGTADAIAPFVQIGNTTSWAGKFQAEGNRIIRNAIAARYRDMEAYFNRMMRLAAAKATGVAA